jgi:hypothetical protein
LVLVPAATAVAGTATTSTDVDSLATAESNVLDVLHAYQPGTAWRAELKTAEAAQAAAIARLNTDLAPPVAEPGHYGTGVWAECAQSATIPYAVLDKNPAAMKGSCVSGQAQVFQFDSATGTKALLANYTDVGYGVWTNNVWFNLFSTAVGNGIYETDVVDYVGRVAGSLSYTTQNNGTNTVPEIDITSLTRVSGPS